MLWIKRSMDALSEAICIRRAISVLDSVMSRRKIIAYSESSISPRMTTLLTHRSSPFRTMRQS